MLLGGFIFFRFELYIFLHPSYLHLYLGLFSILFIILLLSSRLSFLSLLSFFCLLFCRFLSFSRVVQLTACNWGSHCLVERIQTGWVSPPCCGVCDAICAGRCRFGEKGDNDVTIQSRLTVMINDVRGNWTVFSRWRVWLVTCRKVGQETGRWTLLTFT